MSAERDDLRVGPVKAGVRGIVAGSLPLYSAAVRPSAGATWSRVLSRGSEAVRGRTHRVHRRCRAAPDHAGSAGRVTGRVRWEITGGEQVPAQAAALHEQARIAGGRGGYNPALTPLDPARAPAPGWADPPYRRAFPCRPPAAAAQGEAPLAQ